MSLRYDPQQAIAHLGGCDPRWTRLIKSAGAYTLGVDALDNPFRSLLRSIVYQQLSGKAAGTIHGRVKALFPRSTPRPQLLLALDDATLRAAGLSRNKLLALRDLSAKALDGTLPTLAKLHRLEDDEIIERLSSIRGIGRWTVEMMLMFRLGRGDVLPATDLGVRKGYQLVFTPKAGELPAPRHILAHGEAWRPYRTVASWYLYRAVDLHKAARAKSKKP
jgi:3-methyladenine DNA glycosylase/8-oxoguanine DNA glycosylase